MELLKPEFALEFLVNIRENFPKPLVELWGDDIIDRKSTRLNSSHM